MAVAELTSGGIGVWREYEVGRAARCGTEGSHHARVARFVQGHDTQAVVANHMGEPMVHMLERMGVEVRIGAVGDTREAVLRAIDNQP